MEELKRAMEIAISITSENSNVPFELLATKICTELYKKIYKNIMILLQNLCAKREITSDVLMTYRMG